MQKLYFLKLSVLQIKESFEFFIFRNIHQVFHAVIIYVVNGLKD